MIQTSMVKLNELLVVKYMYARYPSGAKVIRSAVMNASILATEPLCHLRNTSKKKLPNVKFADGGAIMIEIGTQ